MSAQYFKNLSGVRGVAAAVVLVSHVVQLHFLRFIGLGAPLHRICSFASDYAVVIFFVLSGYLIAHTLEANIERNGRLDLTVFAAARFARLYPPLLYAIAVSVSVYLIMDVFNLPGRRGPLSLPGDIYAARDVVNLRVSEIVGALAMVQGMLEINGPLWSLYMEAKLYALYGGVLALTTWSWRRHNVILMVALVVVAYLAFRYNPGFAKYAAIWLTGAAAYYVWNESTVQRQRLRVCGALVFFFIAIEVSLQGPSLEVLWLVVREVLVAAAIAWVLFKLRLRLSLGRRLADCSYSLYAAHFPVLLLAQALLLSTGSTSIGEAVGVAICSTSAALAVALTGGVIEARKSAVQIWLLASASRLQRAWVGTS